MTQEEAIDRLINIETAAKALLEDIRKRYELPETESFQCQYLRTLELALKS